MLEALVAIAGTVLTGAVGWNIKAIFNNSSRIAVLEKGSTDAPLLVDAKLDTIVTICEQLEKRLERIERKVLNGEYKADHR